jgi:hypothetical protein
MATEKNCLRCKFLRLRDDAGGLCRFSKVTGTTPPPTVALAYSCEHWQDGGQQYYIRLGWLRALQQEQQDGA